MSDFKRLGCGINCPTHTGFTDCEGAPILSNASLATCADLEKLDPDKPVEPSEYCPSVRMSCAGSYGYGFAPDDNRDPAATVEVKDCDDNVVCYIYPTSAAGHTIAIKCCDGVLVGYSANASQCACPCDIPEATVVTITGTQASGKVIATVSVNGTPTVIKETVTTLKSLSYNKATAVLTAVYTDENGADISKTTSIVSQATAFINGTNPATATIFSLITPPTVNDNTLKNNEDYVYVGTDGTYWIWNGTAYVGAPVPAATTEWLVAGTTVDAKGDKVNKIARTGWVTIGQNIVPTTALDVYRTTPEAYSVVSRFLNPSNKVVGNSTQFNFGAAQETGNCGDFRFVYAGNNSGSNRVDIGFSGYASPTASLLVNGRMGVRQVNPNSTFHVNGSFATPITMSPGAVTLTEFHHTLLLSSPGTAQSLPSASGIDGREYIIKNTSGGNITVTGFIDSSTSNTITIPSKGSRKFKAFSGQWFIVGGYL